MDSTVTSNLAALLFSDIVGSVAMKQRLGDEVYIRQLARHNAIFKSVVGRIARAEVIKSTGDGFLARFPSASAAVEAALLFQWNLSHEPWEREPMKVRVGIHIGEAIDLECFNGETDLAGLAVDLAARLMGLALPGQILLTRAASDAANPLVREHPIVDYMPPTDDYREASSVKPNRPLLCWVSYGLYVFQGHEEPWEVLEVGALPIAPQTMPPDSEKARRLAQRPEPPNHNLPQFLTSFIGRSQELATLKQLLGETLLLTLTGVGGCGKTRLALRLSSHLLPDYPGGVWLVELAAISEPSLVAQQVRNALNLAEQPHQTVSRTIIDHLREKTALLILDNCEHLLAACATLADELLSECPKLKLLVTSQELLGIDGETIYSVPPLSLPPEGTTPQVADLAESEAVTLFIERARAAKPDFSLTHANARAVASICHCVDGIPLAIELAAACVRALTPDEISGRMDERFRFRILTGGSRTALPRHQTLHAAIDWSYQLLTPKCKLLLRRLSVFAGGLTLEAAERVCSDDSSGRQPAEIPESDVLALLISLINRSLVVAEETANGRSRYRLPESVRQFASEELREAGEAPAVKDRHLDFFLTLAEQSEAEVLGEKQKLWLERLEAEHNNLLAALHWCSAGIQSIDSSLRLAGALWCFWDLHGHYAVGRAELTAAISNAPQEPTAALARAFNAAGYLAYRQADYAKAEPLSERSLHIRQGLGDRAGLGRALHNLGNVAHAQGNFTKAQGLYRTALAIHREVGAPAWEASVLANLGEMEVKRADYTSARVLSLEALNISREINNRAYIAWALKNLADVFSHSQDYDSARLYYAESLEMRCDLTDKRAITDSLESVSQLATVVGEARQAARWLAASERLREEIGAPLRPCDREHHQCAVTSTRAVLEPAVFESLWSQGRDTSWKTAVEEILSWLASPVT